MNRDIVASRTLIIREASASDEPFLREMLYHSLYVPDGCLPFDRAVVGRPEIAKYVDGWGRPGDLGLIAVDSSTDEAVGAVCMRIFTASEKVMDTSVTTYRSSGLRYCRSIEGVA